jgi:hypothetical protein
LKNGAHKDHKTLQIYTNVNQRQGKNWLFAASSPIGLGLRKRVFWVFCKMQPKRQNPETHLRECGKRGISFECGDAAWDCRNDMNAAQESSWRDRQGAESAPVPERHGSSMHG